MRHWPRLVVLLGLALAGTSQAAEAPIELAEPKPLPELAFETMDGKPASLGDFKGKVIVLNLWATWCAPCREEMPALDRLQAHFADRPVIVLALFLTHERRLAGRGGEPVFDPALLRVRAFAAGLGLFFSGLPVSAQGGGSISGEVKFTGAAPAPKVVKVNKDNQVCGEEKKVVEVAVGPGGGLAEALVSVTDAKGAKPSKPAVLDQKGCEFHPDVLVMAPGEVKILNSDGVLHNIHTFSTANPPINKAQPKFKKEMTEKLDKPELRVVIDS